MTHFEFMQLTPQAQYHSMAMDGIQVAQRDDGLNKYFLYQMGSFYVESKYHSKPHRLAGIRSFTSTMPLETYLEKIDISGLVRS